MIGMESRITQSKRIAARVVDGKAVVVVIDTRALHTLNEVGTFVWEQLDERERAVTDLVDAIEAAFEVDRDKASKDVMGFLNTMADLGAIEVS